MFTVNTPNSVDGNPNGQNILVVWQAPSGQNWSNNGVYTSGATVSNASGLYRTCSSGVFSRKLDQAHLVFGLNGTLVAGNYTLYVPTGSVTDTSGNMGTANNFPFTI